MRIPHTHERRSKAIIQLISHKTAYYTHTQPWGYTQYSLLVTKPKPTEPSLTRLQQKAAPKRSFKYAPWLGKIGGSPKAKPAVNYTACQLISKSWPMWLFRVYHDPPLLKNTFSRSFEAWGMPESAWHHPVLGLAASIWSAIHEVLVFIIPQLTWMTIAL